VNGFETSKLKKKNWLALTQETYINIYIYIKIYIYINLNTFINVICDENFTKLND
jgi:hypothetical protein